MEQKTNKQCMVTDCFKDIDKQIFDGNFWIKVCKEHALQFREFAMDNNLKFVERDICCYCKFYPVTDFLDACNNCIKKAKELGCDVSDLTQLNSEVSIPPNPKGIGYP